MLEKIIENENSTDFTYQQCGQHNIDILISELKQNFPTILSGSERCHIQSSFYEQEVALLGESQDKPVFCIVAYSDNVFAGMISFEHRPNPNHLFGRMGFVSPAFRSKGLLESLLRLWEKTARLMNCGMLWSHYTLEYPFLQQAMERLGFQVVGILPAIDRDLVEGKTQYVFEIVYAKILVSTAEVRLPAAKDLLPKNKKLWDLLFPSFKLE